MNQRQLTKLPIGIQDFVKLREGGYLYVDKTKYLVDLIDSGAVYFLSRPRRFGKSLTISTLDALFSGKKELFEGLYAEVFLNRPEFQPCPVVRLDMSQTTTDQDVDALRASMLLQVQQNAARYGLEISETSPGSALNQLLHDLAKKQGRVAVLIDEYDKPILDSLQDLEKAEVFRASLRNFYTQIKASDEQTRFVFVTGITKFTKTGIFSAMNNLNDISMDEQYASMLGYTREELDHSFAPHIQQTAEALRLSEEELLEKIKAYYNGFSFDGEHFVYNPFSILNFFSKGKFRNYWFDSGSPSFIVDYIRKNNISVESYRGFIVMPGFASQTEIERAQPASFLFQAGYLTFKGRYEDGYILDYPNLEVLSSIAELVATDIYAMGESYGSLGLEMKRAFNREDMDEVVCVLNRMLAAIPFNLYGRDEKFYHSVFLTVLWGAGITTEAEKATHKGRSDIVIRHQGRVIVLELKIAEGEEKTRRAAEEGLYQIQERGYAEQYQGQSVTLMGLGIDTATRQIGCASVKKRSLCDKNRR